MLTDPTEIAIASNAKQKNIRDPRRSRQPFFNVMEDFFDGVPLQGTYIDLGPGQFDLGELIRERGGCCVGLDMDPAVVELGRYKGFETIHARIQDLVKEPLDRSFDGAFNKFSFNAFWNLEDGEKHRALIEALIHLVHEDAWVWVGPWNGLPKSKQLEADVVQRTLDLQISVFEEHGFQTIHLSHEQAGHYGLHGEVANHIVFIKNLLWKPKGDLA